MNAPHDTNDLVREAREFPERHSVRKWREDGYFVIVEMRCAEANAIMRRLADALEAAEREKAEIIARFGNHTKREAELERELEAAERDVDSEFLRNQELRAQLEAAEKVCEAARDVGGKLGWGPKLREALDAWEKTR